jgi:type II secretory ATPase GspE/PulE/Tfp pilus assembly ATPase PilB-like protein
MPPLASLWSLCLCGELTTFRGPGFYFNLIKLGITIAVYLAWVGAASWVNRDTEESGMDAERWNPVLLGSGLFGLLLLWATPIFVLGLFLFTVCLAAGAGTYLFFRDLHVPESKRILTPDNLRQLATDFINIKKRPSSDVVELDGEEEGRPVAEPKSSKAPVRLFTRGAEGRDNNQDAIARVESSKGYRAAMKLVHDALRQRATDIHLEPMREEMSVRFRVDGLMHVSEPFSRAMGDAVLNIFKVLSNMDITEKRKPQDGSFSAEVEGRQVDFRVASAGSVAGEKLVMRVLDKTSQIISLKQLGMSDRLREGVRSVVRLPHGLVLVCGPTGAGKSTTLYACLNEIDRYQQNIITIENPVEYQLANVTQIEVNIKAGKTFASELRSILRQDPDVIMIGEIRDAETAEIACQAAQTGHMVFSTIHANDTVTAVGRLIDLGVQPFMLSSALTAVLGQRLVRVLCPRCKERYKPNADLLQRLNLPVDKIKYFYRPPGKDDKDGDDEAPRREACDHCGGTGYQGRTGIFELLVLNDAIRRLIRDKPNLNEIKQEAVKAGMRYLYEDGLRQVIEGRTSIQELLRVSK